MIYETLNETTGMTWIGDLAVQRDGIKRLFKCTHADRPGTEEMSARLVVTEGQEYRMREVNA
jgi:hypothetical protein